MQGHVLEHLLAVGLTQTVLPLLEATAFRHINYLHAVHSPSILLCHALPMLFMLHLPTLGWVKCAHLQISALA